MFFRGVPDLAAVLEPAAQRSDGALTAVQELSDARQAVSAIAGEAGSGGAAQSRYERISVGRLVGGEFVRRPRFKRSRGFETISEALCRTPPGSNDASILSLIDRGQHDITVTAGLALRAVQRTLVLASEYESAARFVDPAILAALEHWGQDSRNTIRFSLRRSGAQLTFVLMDKSKRLCPRSGPTYQTCTNCGQWSPLALA
jgi:hypothetical protein